MKYLLLMLIGANAFSMTTVNTSVINAQAINNATNSLAIDARFLTSATFIAEFSSASTTSGASGSLKVQGSNDISNSGNLPSSFFPATTSWVDITASASIASGSLGPISPAMPLSICYRWLRTVWTRVGGLGTMTIKMMGQGQ